MQPQRTILKIKNFERRIHFLLELQYFSVEMISDKEFLQLKDNKCIVCRQSNISENMCIFCKCQKVVKFEKWCILCIIYYRELDYTTGIFQSIGFKEFHEYLILPEEEKHSERGKLLFEKGWQYIIHWNYNFVLIFHYCNTLFVMFSCARKGSFYKAKQIIQFFSIWLIKFGE